MTRSHSLTTLFVIASVFAAGCGASAGEGDATSDTESLNAPCGVTATQNTYDGPNYWGTITIKNSSAAAVKGFSVAFDVPAGAHCTNDAVPSGATLGPLNGSGPSATTTSNHCVFTWASASLAAGASKTFNYSSDSTAFKAASNVVVSSSSCGGGGGTDAGTGGGTDAGTGTGGGGQTINGVYITWYGFNDNSCQTEQQHNCNTIAFPKSDGFKTKHDIATEGAGTYADPITFATAANDSGTSGEFLPGTIIYVPEVRKYFVMEDSCFECGQEWSAKRSYHVDLWMGPSYGSDTNDLNACEDKLTLGSTYHGTGTIIVNPPSNLQVDTNRLFTNNTCTAHTY